MKSSSERPVVLSAEGQQVVGMLHLPVGKGPFPAVLFLHGFTGYKGENRRLFVTAARALAAKGIAALRIDFRGSGDSAGAFSDMSIETEMADAKAALRWLRRQAAIDARRIGITGLSMGGMVTSMTLAAGERAKAVVLWNPVAYPDRLVSPWLSPANKRALRRDGKMDLGGWALSDRFIKNMLSMKPIRAMAPVDTALRVIQGTADTTLPPEGATAYAEARHKAGQAVDLQHIEGADHGFCRLDWAAQALDLTTDWFLRHLV